MIIVEYKSCVGYTFCVGFVFCGGYMSYGGGVPCGRCNICGSMIQLSGDINYDIVRRVLFSFPVSGSI